MRDRQQQVVLGQESSSVAPLQWGVPQGSVIGPLLFACYTTPVQDIIESHGFSCAMYADDTQMYITVNPVDLEQALDKLERCLADVRDWMSSNFLVLNDSKMELLLIRSRTKPCQELPPVTVDDFKVHFSPSVRNLGVILDSQLNMNLHINNICRNGSLALRRIGKIRCYLNYRSTETVVHALVTSLLDNCNSLLIGLPEKQISKLQRIQNSAARLVMLAKRRDHITPILKDLHWLPIKYRIQYKVLLITFKALNGTAPHYISELICSYTPSRCLRSSSQNLLTVPPARTKTLGERAFAHAAPKLWNSLPDSLRCQMTTDQFKKNLKTHLYNIAYL